MLNQPGPMLTALACLLDRSFTQIAEASADARWFDRLTIAAVADVWADNTVGLIRAVAAGGRRR
jgi:hypothetical protein